ncbi:MAG TPA: ferrochelatase [Myxococcota bacterium]|nr:ferrochelatase [Myxococcota bacterium]
MQGIRNGLLLVNTGSPASTQTADLRRYLRQFLSDPRVLDIPAPLRWALVNLVIVPFRAPKSAEAYKKIWTAEGSPLLAHGRALQKGLGAELGPDWQVELGMAVGEPSLQRGLDALASCGRIVLVPLYPQYAGATTGSILDQSLHTLAQRVNVPILQVLPPFYAEPAFIRSVVTVARPQLQEFQPDTLVYSFHGLPESQIKAAGLAEGRRCLEGDCCSLPSAHCYRQHCLTTARLLEAELGPGVVAFQSRLGRARWLEPSLEQVIEDLAKRGSKKVAVIAPSFVADCLETLEEIGQRGAELFREKGGEELRMIPAVNSHPTWVQGLAELVRAVGRG